MNITDKLAQALRTCIEHVVAGPEGKRVCDIARAALAKGWVNCGKCRSPGSCGLTENCFGGHKDNG